MNRKKQIKQKLLQFKDNVLYPLYIRGALGAEHINHRGNKCTSSFFICDHPNKINENLKTFEIFFEKIKTKEEEKVLTEFRALYMEFIHSYNFNFENRMSDLSILKMEINRLKNKVELSENEFDNYISLLTTIKIYEETTKKNLKYKPKFNLKTFDLNKEIDKLEILLQNKFKNMNLIYELSELE